MNEATLHSWLVGGMFVAAALTFVSLTFLTAPYGRHTRAGWGPTVGSRTGWLLMEAPAAATFLVVYALGDHALYPAPLALLALWCCHYVYRGLVYPFRLRAPHKPMPLSVACMGASFNLYNGYINGRQVSQFGDYPDSWLLDPRFLVGAALFAFGWWMNHRADAILFSLRKPGDTGYRVPHGSFYRWVSCPNYLGELVEWSGWALATFSWAGLGFAVYTFANLAPRAGDHHRWYRATFPDYPPERKALIPLVW